MRARDSLQPNSPEERQAALTVRSAKDVLGEIDHLQRLLSLDGQSPGLRRRAKADLEEASERLCNLMALAHYQIGNNLQGALQQRLRGVLDSLRDRLLDVATQLMVEKVRKIHHRAKVALNGKAYPIGLARKLDHAYSSILDHMMTLRGLERLDQSERQLFDETAISLGNLATIEEGLGVLTDIERHRRPARATVGLRPVSGRLDLPPMPQAKAS